MDGETSLAWPGQTLPTSGGLVFVRHRPGAEPHLEPALFVHGLGGESLDWVDVAGMLADRVDAHALDLPGFGDSPPPRDGDLSLDGHARAVAGVVRSIGRGPCHLIGNSLGGAVTLRVAADHPELVRSLTLISPAMPDLRPRFWSTQLTIALVPVLGPWLVRSALRGDPERMARRIYALCYGDPAAVTAERHARELASLRRRAELAHSAKVYRSSLRAVVSSYVQRGPRRLWRQAANVDVPTLLIYGGRDKLVDPRMAARAQATFPSTQLVLLLDAGHVAHIEHPARVAGALREFLDAQSPARAVELPDLHSGMAGARGTVVRSDADEPGRVR